MAFWAVRAGKHGEFETYNLDSKIVSIGWAELGDLKDIKDRDALAALIARVHLSEKKTRRDVWIAEVWMFRSRIKEGDIVALPLKSRSAVAFGQVTGPYRFVPTAPEGAKHQRPVKWIRTDLPRSEIPENIRNSLGSTLTVFEVRRNNAEARILAQLEGRVAPAQQSEEEIIDTAQERAADITQIAEDRIIAFIRSKFKEHEFTRLVAGVLSAQGYQVWQAPPGPDGGVDILAGSGPMGFDAPRIAVQVKSSEYPVDVGVLRELTGVMDSFGADQGMIVSWGGFKESVLKEARRSYFKIRLWNAGDLIEALQQNYLKLSPELQAELSLKTIWVLVDDQE
ncbi:MAG: restriction endonuclease [Rhodospirillales bacterium]